LPADDAAPRLVTTFVTPPLPARRKPRRRRRFLAGAALELLRFLRLDGLPRVRRVAARETSSISAAKACASSDFGKQNTTKSLSSWRKEYASGVDGGAGN
jgi:hypothetical protein